MEWNKIKVHEVGLKYPSDGGAILYFPWNHNSFQDVSNFLFENKITAKVHENKSQYKFFAFALRITADEKEILNGLKTIL